MTRVYVGTSLDEIVSWRGAGEIPAGTIARAVTDDVVAALDDSDDEEREYAVSQLAAEDSRERTGGAGRIAVLVAERADTEPAGDVAEVRVRAAIGWRDVVAVLVDQGSGTAAHESSDQPSDDVDLAWYTPAELDTLTRGDV